MDISYGSFLDDKGEGYIEIYFALAGNSLDLTTNNEGKLSGGVDITFTITQDSNFVTGDKFRILSPAVSDSLQIPAILLQQQRYNLQQGTYNLHFILTDVNDPEEVYEFDNPFTFDLNSTEIASSKFMFLDSYEKASGQDPFAKSGYKLMPLVSSGSYYFPADVTTLPFYVELYNIDDSLGTNEPYLLKYYIEYQGKMLKDHSRFAKKMSSPVQPLLANFNITDLPSGNYTAVVEVLGKTGETKFRTEQFFYRQNTVQTLDPETITSEEVAGSWVDLLGNHDSLYTFIEYLYPISTETQQNYQQSLLAEKDLNKMKSYFYAFWYNKNSLDPQSTWEEYKHEVKLANGMFGGGLHRGFLTEQGRVFLVYGRPNNVVKRQIEPTIPPYEIWQYNQVKSPYTAPQSNKVFVFVDMIQGSNDYKLVHSDAIGELSNRRWQYDLSRGYQGMGSDIDDNGNGMGGEFGSRLNNNIIFDSGNLRENR